MSDLPALKPGDQLCVTGGMFGVSAGIRLVERFWAKDNEASYGHCAIVGTEGGTLLDTLWTVRWTHISRYAGQQMIIARPTHTLRGLVITDAAKSVALKMISSAGHGRPYPVHRIALHLIPPLAKYFSAGRQMVCSERSGKINVLLGSMDEPWAGLTPDDLADRYRCWRNFDVIFEGTCPRDCTGHRGDAE
jgi:hypothetical protein